jgi:hypothetical protein
MASLLPHISRLAALRRRSLRSDGNALYHLLETPAAGKPRKRKKRGDHGDIWTTFAIFGKAWAHLWYATDFTPEHDVSDLQPPPQAYDKAAPNLQKSAEADVPAAEDKGSAGAATASAAAKPAGLLGALMHFAQALSAEAKAFIGPESDTGDMDQDPVTARNRRRFSRISQSKHFSFELPKKPGESPDRPNIADLIAQRYAYSAQHLKHG